MKKTLENTVTFVLAVSAVAISVAWLMLLYIVPFALIKLCGLVLFI